MCDSTILIADKKVDPTYTMPRGEYRFEINGRTILTKISVPMELLINRVQCKQIVNQGTIVGYVLLFGDLSEGNE